MQLVVTLCITLSLLYLYCFVYLQSSDSAAELSSQWQFGNGDLGSIYNSTLGFERIYVINLPSRTDRRDALVLMSALTGIKLDWIDGVDGETVPDKALPQPASHDTIKSANIGSWRAHLNAIQAVVKNNLSSALILEDDADWDIRIKKQLQDFALTSRALLQRRSSLPHVFADFTLRDPTSTSDMPDDILFDDLPATISPAYSPYGDDWDVLWLGHCGTEFPNTNLPSKVDLSKRLPRGRVVHMSDITVPEDEYLHDMSEDYGPRKIYPPHTRVTHHVMGSICSLGYAVSQKGARRLLYELGVRKFDGAFDVMLRDVCEGSNDRPRAICLTVQPQLFNHHRPAGHSSYYSDISVHEEKFVEKPLTEMIRWSTRMNLPKLIAGETDYDDQWPDH